MEKKYKDILIVRCRPKSRETSADRPVDKSCAYVNGATKNINGVSKTIINGLTKSNGVTKNVNGFTRSVNSATKNFNGVTENVNGPIKNINDLNKNINGLTKNINGLTENINGLTENINGLTENSNGLAKCINGFAPNSNKINGISIKLNGTSPPEDVNHNINGFTDLSLGSTAVRSRSSRRVTVGLPLHNCINSAHYDPSVNSPPRRVAPTPRSVSHSPSRQLTRKISTPSAITITSGGFHCDGRIPRDDYLPDYIKLLEASDARSNKLVDSIKSVPVSPLSSRRLFSCSQSTQTQQPLARPTRSSVTVLTESPQFARNTNLFSWCAGSNTPTLEHPLSKLSTRNRNPRLLRSISNTPLAYPSSDIPEELSTQPSVSCRRQAATIGNKSGCSKLVGGPASETPNMSSSEEGVPTARDLVLMLQSVKPVVGPLPGHEMDRTPRYLAGVCMDECYPGLYIGDMGAAKDRAYLKRVGVTHVLNTAEGNKMCTVDTDAQFYKEVGIEYLGLQLLDVPSANISQYFEKGAEFIDACLSNEGKVLVHCFMGISRSSTIAAAYLMHKRGMTALEALTTLRQHRSIYPNDGFLHQLIELDKRLRKERGKP